MTTLRSSKAERGFTLVELLMTVAIIGILAGIAIFAGGAFNNTNNTAKACEAELTTVQTASDAYYSSNSNVFAANVNELVASGLLKSPPSSDNGYRIDYNPTTGLATAKHGPSFSVDGCPT